MATLGNIFETPRPSYRPTGPLQALPGVSGRSVGAKKRLKITKSTILKPLDRSERGTTPKFDPWGLADILNFSDFSTDHPNPPLQADFGVATPWYRKSPPELPNLVLNDFVDHVSGYR